MSVTLIGLCSEGISDSTCAALSDTELSEVFWPLFGAEGEGASSSSEGAEDDDQDDDDDEDESDGEGEEDGEDDKTPANAAEAKRLAAKNAKLRKRLREQKAEVEAARKEKETAQNVGKDETERLRAEVETLTNKLQERDERLQQSTLRQAFLESNKVQWHDPKTAMRLLDTSDIDIDEDGDVSGMDDAIKALAEQHPYLVKSGGKSDDENKGGKRKSNAKGSSGEGGTKRKKDSDGVDREALLRKYPALR